MLVSGRFALLNDGLGFSLVPWRPVIEQRLGQTLSAIVRANDVAWEVGRQRGRSPSYFPAQKWLSEIRDSDRGSA
jgi:Protein of unknown function (DUF3363)